MKKLINKFYLSNKISFVIGGVGLIGKEISKAFCSAGSTVIILDNNKIEGEKFAKKMKNNGFDFKFHYFDCSKIEKLNINYDKIIKKYGCPSVFVNCSYPYTNHWNKSGFKEIKIKYYLDNINSQLNSYIWLAFLAAKYMKLNKINGSIIQMGSIYGLLAQDLNVYTGTSMKENMTYSVIKGGIVNFTRQLASYYGNSKIRVNTICAGGIKGHVAGLSKTQDLKFLRNYGKKTLLKRLGKPEEIACAALFLASEASSYITGTTLVVDGGWSAV